MYKNIMALLNDIVILLFALTKHFYFWIAFFTGNSTQYFAEKPSAAREKPSELSPPKIPPNLLSHYLFELDAPEKHWRALLTLLKSYRILAARYTLSYSTRIINLLCALFTSL